MDPTPSLEEQVAALDRGLGWVSPARWVLVRVTGQDAEGWLNDLVTARIDTLVEGGAVRSLLLGPTGRIRADLLVHRLPGALLLLQSPGQPRRIDDLLEPYVLSSDVALEATSAPVLVGPDPSGAWRVRPGEGGAPSDVGPEALESWRIRRGQARFPVDLDEESLPAEAGLDEAPVIDRTKGCYLGQESVAKVRNLGHPTRIVVPVTAASPLPPGTTVLADGAEAGTLTSVDVAGGGMAAIARIRWEARGAELKTEDGVELLRVEAPA